jgi:hypothetical protein
MKTFAKIKKENKKENFHVNKSLLQKFLQLIFAFCTNEKMRFCFNHSKYDN